MKKLIFLIFLCSLISYGQTITVDSNTYSATGLATLLVQNACIVPTNVSYSSGQSVAYFNKNGSSFPINEGVIIRNGIAQYTEGLYTNTNLSSQINSNSDADLQAISNASGQTSTITDVAFLQFDFVSIANSFDFNFLFASNEYGEFQCAFSDVFAFLLTDITTGITTNIAVIPGTSTPVSVKDVRDTAYNSSCTSINANLFGVYNVANPSASSLNMRGITTILHASTATIPNKPYRIKLIIGDYNDATYDSAVFISSGSFTSSVDLGSDATICSGANTTITSGLAAADYTHTWFFNGNLLPAETGNSLVVSQSGSYQVNVIKNGTTCEMSDTIVFTELTVNNPEDIYACNDGSGSYTYNLTTNNTTVLGINSSEYQLFYYNSLANVAANNFIPTSEINNYLSNANETIYIKLYNTTANSFCDALYSFDLLLTNIVAVTQPNDINLCNTISTTSVNVSSQETQLLNGQNANDYLFTYYANQADALAGTNAIGSTIPVSLATSPILVWVRMENVSNSNCSDVTSFSVFVHPLPLVDTIADVLECSQYTLPPISNGNYFSGPNGTGNALNIGDVIDEIGTYYIFNGPDANGCTNESSFFAQFMDDYTIDLEHCDEFIVPTPPAGDFYTQTGGPNGTGTIIAPGTIISSSQTIYFYVEIDDVFCRDEAFPIVILPKPAVDTLPPVVACFSYTLQPLTNGNYFENSGGTGTAYFAGDHITTTTTLFIYVDDGSCTNESDFEINILNQPDPVAACGEYNIPTLGVGNYYSLPDGQGSIIPAGTILTTSQTIYFYANTTITPNCTSNFSVPITINPIPLVDELNDVAICENDTYILPNLTNGNYYSSSGGTGTLYNTGDVINSTQTLYIYNEINGCSNESNFTINVVPLPLVDNFTDEFRCEYYPLPVLANGSYYTESGGNGTNLIAGTLIQTTQTIYIYNEVPNVNGCHSENVFVVNILGVFLDPIDNIFACDSYTLPPLVVGDYYKQPDGVDIINPSEYTISTLGTQTIYVYAENGNRYFCDDEISFELTISQTPTLPVFNNVAICETYTLPALDNSLYDVNYYFSPNGVDLINVTDYTFDVAGTYIIYVYATAFNNVACFDQATFSLTIFPFLDLEIDDGIMCVDPITNAVIQPAYLSANLDPNFYAFNWYFNASLVHTGSFYNATQVGTYTVEIIKLVPNISCNYNPATVEVSQSSFAVAEAIVSADFDDDASITINILNGYGNYQFQLDNGTFQSNNVFYNVSSGEHVISVKDVYGNCNTITLKATVLKYPRFFTPNGDGYNDTWNIWDLKNNTNATIYIFDRYGKFIKQFKTRSNGWDGKLNGYDLPSTDYWFVVNYKNQFNEDAVFKAHFSMKR